MDLKLDDGHLYLICEFVGDDEDLVLSVAVKTTSGGLANIYVSNIPEQYASAIFTSEMDDPGNIDPRRDWQVASC